ncbi:MAG TPA: hypothetical protein VFM88_05720 [Vicinamibacteria bacterium]|nr:hypothetical protein [Vicinamibacteria bacterium]
MTRVLRLLARAALAAVACAAAARASADSEFLPEIGVRLQAARYLPSEVDLVHEGWIGANAGLARFGRTTAFLAADVETILGSERREFEANQANYHLELGARRALSRDRALTLFLHHVSRHAQDRDKPEAVDWNLLGVRFEAPFPSEFKVPGRVAFGFGHTTQHSLIGYEWELTGQALADLVTRRFGSVYGAAAFRLVSADPEAPFERRGFLDFQAEGGARFRRNGRMIEVFLALDHRNDVLIAEPLTETRALIGFRIRVGRRHFAAPEDPRPRPAVEEKPLSPYRE